MANAPTSSPSCTAVGSPTRAHVRALLGVGLPTALQLGLEVGAFAILTAFISTLSETQMAAHQIALQACQFSFLPAFAIAEGAQVLAGQAVGARREALVMRVAWLAVLTAGVYTAVCSLAFALGAPLIVAGFTSSAALAAVTVRLLRVAGLALVVAGAYTALCSIAFALGAPLIVAGFTASIVVGATTVRLLRVAALFQISDGANIVARAVLRGVGDMRFAAVIGVLTAWLMTPPLTWLLGAHAHLGAAGGWLGLCGESVLGSLILWRRVRSGAWRNAGPSFVDGGAHAQAA